MLLFKSAFDEPVPTQQRALIFPVPFVSSTHNHRLTRLSTDYHRK